MYYFHLKIFYILQQQYTQWTETMCCPVCKLKLYERFCPYDNILNFMGYLGIGLIKEN